MKQSCRLLGVTQQAYYQQRKYVPHKIVCNEQVISYIKAIRKEQPKAGIRVMYQSYKTDYPQSLGLYRFTKIAREAGLVQKPFSKKIITTKSDPRLGVSPDLYNGRKHDIPNRFWVNDITYIKHKKNTSYLFLTSDAASRKILGWILARDMGHQHAIEALNMAIINSGIELEPETSKVLNNLVFHSDKGGQYQAKEMMKELKNIGAKSSMTQGSDSRKNAKIERINGILKNEFLIPFGSDDMEYEELNGLIDKVIGTYNSKRLHTSLNYNTPDEAHQGAKIVRLWVSRWEKPRCLREYIGEYIANANALISVAPLGV